MDCDDDDIEKREDPRPTIWTYISFLETPGSYRLEGLTALYRTPEAAAFTLEYPKIKFLWHSREYLRRGYLIKKGITGRVRRQGGCGTAQ
jgi:hypothetical protein